MAFWHLFGTKQKGCQRFAMRLPSECYQMQQTVQQHIPHLRHSQITGLVLWVYGTILARSSCQNAVATALSVMGNYNSLRQYLRGCFQSIEFVLTYMHDTKTIPQRPNRRTVGCSNSPTPSSQARWTTTYSGPAGGAQRHLVCASERMPMADAPARSATLADSVQILPQVDDGWNVGKSP